MKKESFDFKNEFPHLYRASAQKARLIEVPELTCLTCSGSGVPGSEDYGNKIARLFAVAYTLKFMQRQNPTPFKVAPLGCLYDAADPTAFCQPGREEEWRWVLFLPLPPCVTAADVTHAKTQLEKKKGLGELTEVGVTVLGGCQCAQMLHVGPYDQVGATYAALHDFIQVQGHRVAGPSQEVYLNDCRRTAPERLKTIVRLPILGSGL